jgi:hypothetical protein
MWTNGSKKSVHSGCAVTADVDFDGTVGIGGLLVVHN